VPLRLPRLAGLVAAAAILAYSPIFGGKYIQDDHLAIEDNEIVARGHVGEIFSTSYWEGARGNDRTLYRPFAIWSFALERAAAGQPSPPLTRGLNLAIHLLVSLTLGLLAARVGAGSSVAFSCALLFALHPVHVEAVAGGVGRAELLAALFSLAALLLMSVAGDWRVGHAPPNAAGPRLRRLAAWSAAVCVFAALGSKETAAALLPLLVVQELLFRPPARGAFRAWLIERAAALAPTALAVTVYLVLRIRALELAFATQTVPLADNPLVGLAGSARLAAAFGIAARALRLLVWPWPLSADYSGTVLTTTSGPAFVLPWIGFVSLAALFLLAFAPWLLARPAREGVRPASLAAWLWLLPYLVVGNVLFLVGAGLAERFLYLPSAGFCLLAAIPAGSRRRAIVLGSLLVIATLMGGATFARSRHWKDDRTLFESATRVNPGSPRPHFIIASLAEKEGDLATARAQIEMALRSFPDYPPGWHEKGLILAKAADMPGAEAAFRETLRLQPEFPMAMFNLGLALHRQGKTAEAERSLRKAVLLEPSFDKAWAELGHVFFETKRYGRALEAYRRAVALGRSDLEFRMREAARFSAEASP
jgi:tetratricopeptide (TPR) repeat protein